MIGNLISAGVKAVGGLLGGSKKQDSSTQIIRQPDFSHLTAPIRDSGYGNDVNFRRYLQGNETEKAETTKKRGYEEEADYGDDPLGLARMWADLLTIDNTPERNRRKYAKKTK